MGLDEYKRKRDFRVTAEPEGHVHPSGDVLSFCIQKHAASHLHFDFRLELDGVLKSWAVPKGPSLDPAVKRLAVHVEDHPLEYGAFEGIIPKKEYGGGTVMLWDRGTWSPDADPHVGYRKGHLRFHLHGERLQGGWHLVRSRRGEEGQKEQWLLFKDDDDEARPESEGIITQEVMTSVDTGRTMEEIAADADARWDSKAPAAEAMIRQGKPSKTAAKKPAAKSAAKKGADFPAAGVSGARKAPFPANLVPQMATLVDDVPAGADWIHEIKYDGYRLVVLLRDGTARLITRNGNDWSDRFPETCAALSSLPVRSAILDGELVVLDRKGATSFQALQNVLNSGRRGELVFYAFDLPYLEGMDLRGAPLVARKEALRALLAEIDPGGAVRFSDHIVGRGAQFYAQACGMGLEGIMSKRADSHYQQKRTKDWVKVKCLLRQEFVIGGYTDPRGSRPHFGALLLGVYDEKGDFVYTGKVGTGFDHARLRDVSKRLKKLERADSPFIDHGRRRTPAGVHWVDPKLVCEIAFTEWTGEGILRHPVFQGLREDKPARQVVRERPAALPEGEAADAESEAAKPAGRARAAERASRDQHPAARTRPVPPSTQSAGRRRGKGEEMQVAGIRISSPDKVLYPASGLTKLDLARYYEAVGERMLPHVEDRPLTLVRCPDGVAGDCFYQKHGDQHFHESIGRVTITENDGDPRVYTYVDSIQALVAMVQMGVLELHTSNARRDGFERPDRFVIDLDPAPDVPWTRVVESAFQVRDRLEELRLDSWVKTTGGKGLHVVVPLARRHTWDEVKDFTKAFSADLSARNPGKYLIKATIAARKGKIFIDYLRNGRGATSIGAYCIRAKPSGACGVPLRWEELTPALRPDSFTPQVVIERVARMRKDPWDGYWASKQTITKAMRTAVGMKK